MKKIKTLSVRLSSEFYDILKDDYKFYKVYYNENIKSFSDYIRLTLDKGLNE